MAGFEVYSEVVGMVATNCYFIKNTETDEMIIVDPADQAALLIRRIDELGGKPAGILLTHGHFDHILAVKALRSQYNIKVYIHEKDEDVMDNPMLNLSGMWSTPCSAHADVLVKEGDILELAGFRIKVYHTPGHTHGSCCYYFENEKFLISGDTIFFGSYGRTDFPTSSQRDMENSVRRMLSILPDDTVIYPGHDSYTTVANEKRINPLAP